MAVRRRLGLDDGTLLLLIVAHNFPLKGVPALLTAMGRMAARRRPVHLAVVGGKHLERWEQAARRQGARSSVTFTGSVRDTVPFYAAADAYVHPTFHDSCSLVVLEALASGLPVVTSRFNGASELITEGVEGFVLPDPADVNGLLEKLDPLFKVPTRREMGQAARRLALQRTLQRNVDEVLAVYDEVIETRARDERRRMHRAQFPFVVRRSPTAESPRPARASEPQTGAVS